MMSKLIEIIHVSLGGEIGSLDWAIPYLDEQHEQYASKMLNEAEALVLGRKTYQGLSAAYTAMPSTPFVERMNAIRKYVASTTLDEIDWGATVIEGDVSRFVEDLKLHSTGHILKYGNGILDLPLMEKRLIDEFHLLLTPVAVGAGQHLFESINGCPRLNLMDVERFKSGVLRLVYTP
jgi:dihydrofolate reductase